MNLSAQTFLLSFVTSLFTAAALAGDCSVRESKETIEGSEMTVVTLENDRVRVEIVPDQAGLLRKFTAKDKNAPLLQHLYGYVETSKHLLDGACTYRIDASGPERASVSLSCKQKVADADPPAELTVERKISIDHDSSRLVVETKITNPGEAPVTVAPGVFLQFAAGDPKHAGEAVHWFLPAAGMVELFDAERGRMDMAEANFGDGAPVGHRFSAFTPGESAPNPRYEAGGWAAVETASGRVFVSCEHAEAEPLIPLLGGSFFEKTTLPAFAYMQYKFAEHDGWKLMLDPHPVPGALNTGESRGSRITLALDSADVSADLTGVALSGRSVPPFVRAGDTVELKLRASVALAGKTDRASFQFSIKKDGAAAAQAAADVPLHPPEAAGVDLKAAIPEHTPPGEYTWSLAVNDKVADYGQLEVAAKNADAKKEAAAVQITPERLELLKKGGEWWYDQIIQGRPLGSFHLVLAFDAASKTFTLTRTSVDRQMEFTDTAVYSAEAEPQPIRFSRAYASGEQMQGEVKAGVLTGVDFDGDAYSVPWHDGLVLESALPLIAMAQNWARARHFELTSVDPETQDLLPADLIVPRTEKRTVAGQNHVCTVVRMNDLFYVVDEQGRIVEIASAQQPQLWRLTDKPKFKPEAKKTNDPEAVDAAVAHMLVEKTLENPPATGQLVQMAFAKALRAGLMPGDIITSYDGASVETYPKLHAATSKASSEQKESIEVAFVRGGETKTIKVGPGLIGVQCASVTKGKAVDLEDAQFGSMGYGPGPKPPPSALEKLAREKCGSQIPWLSDYDKALEQAKKDNKPVLFWATVINGASMYKLKMYSDYMTCGLFTNPNMVQYINAHFTPYAGPLTMKQKEAFGLKHIFVPALLFVNPDGTLLHEVDGITSYEPEFFMSVFARLNGKGLSGDRGSNINPAASLTPDGFASLDKSLNELDTSSSNFEATIIGSAELESKFQGLYLLGRLRAVQHKSDDAIAALQEGLRIGGDKKLETSMLAEWAWVLIRSNRPQKALDLLAQNSTLGAEGPRAAELGFVKGVGLLMVNRDAEARTAWKETAEKYPDDPWGWRCAAEFENIGPLSRGVESPLWIDNSELIHTDYTQGGVKLKPLPHTTQDTRAADAREAARTGVEYLLEHQSADGGWNDTDYDFGNIKAMPNVRTAVTAICAEALLGYRELEPARIDAALQKAFEYLSDRKHIAWEDKNEIIWAHFYRINFFAAFLRSQSSEKVREKVRDEMQQIANILTRDQIGPQGFYRHEYENEFVTGSVLISLRLAKDCGLSVDSGAVKRACDALESVRTPRGTWPYETAPAPDTAWKGSIGRAVNCETALLAWERGSPPRLAHAIEQYLRYDFVQDRVYKEAFHSDRYAVAGFFYWYNQHVLSQAIRLTDIDTAKHAREFMRKLVLSTREIDGTWVDSLELGKTYATGMALMVLKAGEE